MEHNLWLKSCHGQQLVERKVSRLYTAYVSIFVKDNRSGLTDWVHWCCTASMWQTHHNKYGTCVLLCIKIYILVHKTYIYIFHFIGYINLTQGNASLIAVNKQYLRHLILLGCKIYCLLSKEWEVGHKEGERKIFSLW